LLHQMMCRQVWSCSSFSGGSSSSSSGEKWLQFSQCNTSWGGFPQARGAGCQRFDSGWCFIST
jgi:hypothetical protein